VALNSDSATGNSIAGELRDTSIAADTGAIGAAPPTDLRDPRVVLALLEADQVVAAKRQSHFGRARLTFVKRAMLSGLRVYVVVMFVIVLVSVVEAARGAH
jgi:hypothetical protein